MSVCGVHMIVSVWSPRSGMSVIIAIIWRRWVRRRELRTSVRVVMGVHCCEGAGCQFGGSSAFHSATESRENFAFTESNQTIPNIRTSSWKQNRIGVNTEEID